MKILNEKLLFESLYDVIPYNTHVVDIKTYEVVFVNRAFSDSRGDLAGTICHQAIYQEDSPCIHCKIKDLVNEDGYPNGKTIIFDHFNPFDDHWYQMQEKALVWPDGRTVKCSIAVDITELKETQNSLAEAHADLALKTRELERLSVTDKLTGVSNRLRLDEVIKTEMGRAERYGHPLALIMADIDNFKKVNDTYGHQVGDEALVGFARILKKNSRSSDTVGRWGGEEFMILLPETDLKGAARKAEELRQHIVNRKFPGSGRLTACFGVAQFKEGEEEKDFVRRVDMALYKAKASGRNRVEVAG